MKRKFNYTLTVIKTGSRKINREGTFSELRRQYMTFISEDDTIYAQVKADDNRSTLLLMFTRKG